MLYRFKSSLLGKQILQVSKGPQEVVADENGTMQTIIVWYDADRYEAEALLRIKEDCKDGNS